MTEQPKNISLRKTATLLRRRSIYLLPNLFTTAALFSGFFSVIHSIDGHFRTAAIAIFVAMIFDGLDGRVARLTHTQSAFGVEYDSLSDMISFGIAPAILVYEWALKDASKLGWAAAFIYCAATALRLARFNTNVSVTDKRFFQGLPSPAAAAVIAGMVWVMYKYHLTPVPGEMLFTAVWVITVLMGLLMVSNIPYYSGKSINLRQSVSAGTIMILVILMVFLTVFIRKIALILFSLFLLYAASGIALSIWRGVIRGIRSFSKTASAAIENDKKDNSIIEK